MQFRGGGNLRILLVEDDHFLGDSVLKALLAENYTVDWLTEGRAVSTALISENYDLVILDNRLPGQSGLDILRELREAKQDVPVLMLTACDALEDKIRGLDAGADDYLTKPFEMLELFARVRSLMRRRGDRSAKLAGKHLEMDVAERKVVFHGECVDDLTAKEFAILEILLRNKGRFVTKHRLLEGCSSWDSDITPNTIEVYISRLRKRFGSELIETLRGVGYRVQAG